MPGIEEAVGAQREAAMCRCGLGLGDWDTISYNLVFAKLCYTCVHHRCTAPLLHRSWSFVKLL